MSTIATRQPEKPTVISELKRVEPFLAESLPKHLNVDRFARLALTTIRKNPRLGQTDPASFIGALYTAAALGLEPEVNGEAYLVPYGRETQLVIGYQGIAKLFWQHPLAAQLSAEYVCENDEFEYDKGLTPRLHHKPALGDRGEVIAYYAIVGLKTGATWFDVFSPAQIAKLRAGSKKSNIADPEHWMARKTALRQVLKLAPKATQLQMVDHVDERTFRDVEAAQQIVAPDHAAIEAPESEKAPGEQINQETGEVMEAEVVTSSDYDDAAWMDGGTQ